MIDFNSIQTLGRANPVRNRRVTWKLKRKMKANGTNFIFSQSLFDELNLAENSLEAGYAGNDVFLIVHPGNGGKWAKSSAKGKKGKSFKNEELASRLDSAGLTAESLDLESVGVNPNNDLEYFKIVEFAVAENDGPENPNTEEDPVAEMSETQEFGVQEESPAEAVEVVDVSMMEMEAVNAPTDERARDDDDF